MSGVLHGVIASLKAAAAAVTDAFFEYVTLLLNTTSTNGAQNNTFLDSSTNNFTVTRNGDTTQGSFNPYMPSGYWSGYFDGTGDYLTAPDNAAWAFGTGAFTIEFWYNPSSLASFQVLVQQGATDANRWIAYWSSTNGLCFDVVVSGTATIICRQNATTGWSAGSWYHVAIVRNGNDFAIYRNGVSIATTTDTDTVSDYAGTLYVGGGNLFGDASTNGYLSNVRIVTGTAVYTSAFTPSTSPLTAITNTSLLCLQDNRFKDNSANNFTITINGDTRISKFAPFGPTTPWTPAVYGGSGYFDGTGDYLTLASNAAFGLGTGDFTIEMWVYATANPANGPGTILDLRTGPTATATSVRIDSSLNVIFYDGPANSAINVGTIQLNTWTHIAHARASGSLKTYINGTLSNTTSVTSDLGSNQPCMIGNAQAAGYAWNGYLSNLRIVKGTAVYTAGFTPPTTPLTAITNTSLLLNFTNAGIYDAATINDAQTVGNAQVSTTQAKWGTTSMYFDGVGDWLNIIDKPELRFGTAPFTIEAWVYPTTTNNMCVVSVYTGAAGWSFRVDGNVVFWYDNTGGALTGTLAVPLNTWTHIAAVREGTGTNQFKMYVNGVLDVTATRSANFNQTTACVVGAQGATIPGNPWNGYIDELRITNGYARYTANFTPPTAAFPLVARFDTPTAAFPTS